MTYRAQTSPLWRELRFQHRFLVIQYLRQADGRVAKAAELAGVQRQTLQRWMREFGVSVLRSKSGRVVVAA